LDFLAEQEDKAFFLKEVLMPSRIEGLSFQTL
jgi:hypothetical protein